MEQKKFNVLRRDFNKKRPTFYDVLPYFRREWKERPYNWNEDNKEVLVKTKEELKKWIKDRSQYQFWSRCEYEFLIAKWPFGGRQLTEDMEKFIASGERFLNTIVLSNTGEGPAFAYPILSA